VVVIQMDCDESQHRHEIAKFVSSFLGSRALKRGRSEIRNNIARRQKRAAIGRGGNCSAHTKLKLNSSSAFS